MSRKSIHHRKSHFSLPFLRETYHPVFPKRNQLWQDRLKLSTVKVLAVVDGYVFFRAPPSDPLHLLLPDFLDVYIRKH